MAPRGKCSRCEGSFLQEMFKEVNESTICLFCDLREASLQELNNLRRQIAEERSVRDAEVCALKEEVSALKELVSNSISNFKTNSYVPSFSSPSGIGSSSSLEKKNPEVDRSNTTTHQTDTFSMVKKGFKPRNQKEPTPIITCNRFDPIIPTSDDITEEEDLVLIGDSLVRNQDVEFCGRNPKGRRRYCYPGHSLSGRKRLQHRVVDYCEDTDEDTTFIIHIGTNDVEPKDVYHRPQELIRKYQNLLSIIRENSGSNKFIITGLIPRMGESRYHTNRRRHINHLLQDMATRENGLFGNLWNHFEEQGHLYQKDGLHLNEVGSARMGRLLHKLAISCSKN